MSLLTKACVIATCGLVALVTVAGPASATPTANERSSGSDSFVTHNTCVDPVRVDSVWDIMIHTFFDSNGDATRLSFTGTTVITYTDLSNGQSFSPNSSGPGTIDLATGQSVVRGSNAAVFNSDGILVATDGRLVYDASGNLISIVGHQTGVCAALGTTPA